jgi:hypothetical protein
MTMRFEDVSARLGAPVRYPGGHGDGLALNVAIPSIGKMRIWQAIHGGYTWAISFEPGLPQWSADERAKFVGYSASYRRTDHRRSSQTILIDGGPWDSLAKAEQACQWAWRQIRNAS